MPSVKKPDCGLYVDHGTIGTCCWCHKWCPVAVTVIKAGRTRKQRNEDGTEHRICAQCLRYRFDPIDLPVMRYLLFDISNQPQQTLGDML